MDIFLLSYDINRKQQELNKLHKLHTSVKKTTNSPNSPNSTNSSKIHHKKEYIKIEKLLKLCNQEYEISVFNI